MELVQKSKEWDPRQFPEKWEDEEIKALEDYLYKKAYSIELEAKRDTALTYSQAITDGLQAEYERKKKLREEQELKRAYRYMLTFTLKPDALSLADEAEKYIRKQAERAQTLGIIYYAFSKELTKKGVPHWHVVIESKKPLKKDRFNYYTSKFGNLDFSRTKAQTTQEALNYISKDGAPEVIIS